MDFTKWKHYRLKKLKWLTTADNQPDLASGTQNGEHFLLCKAYLILSAKVADKSKSFCEFISWVRGRFWGQNGQKTWSTQINLKNNLLFTKANESDTEWEHRKSQAHKTEMRNVKHCCCDIERREIFECKVFTFCEFDIFVRLFFERLILGLWSWFK
jgi:hypothetical protein